MTLRELGEKDVIRLSTGEKLGRIDDIRFEAATGKLEAAVLHGRSRFFGFLGSEEDLEIPWQEIQSIGSDVVMVETDSTPHRAATAAIRGESVK